MSNLSKSNEVINNHASGKKPVIKNRKQIEKTAFNDVVLFENPGDSFTGKVQEVRETTTKYGVGEVADFVDIETGELKSLFITSNLKTYDLGQRIGQWLCITFDNYQRNPKTKQLYKNFNVEELEVEE